MPTPAELTTWPFLSIVAWPEGWDRTSVAELLAGYGALDLPTLNMRFGQKPPMVLNRVEPAVAAAMIAALVERGGDGFRFTLDDLARLGPTLRIANVAVGEGTLELKLHAGAVPADPVEQAAVGAVCADPVRVGREKLRRSLETARRIRDPAGQSPAGLALSSRQCDEPATHARLASLAVRDTRPQAAMTPA